MTQQFLAVEKIDLVNKALDMKKVGFRLAQICATKLDDCTRPPKTGDANPATGINRRGPGTLSGLLYILHYSFVKDNMLVTFRSTLQPGQVLESISFLYPYAFLYENELKDLFGIEVLNLNIDFKGHLYETAAKAPFSMPSENPEVIAAAAKAAAARAEAAKAAAEKAETASPAETAGTETKEAEQNG